MKYMGSKRSMLQNGLGEVIAGMVPGHKRFVDLFTGSGAVAWHVGQEYDVKVLATDLQRFCVTLASGVISRTSPVDDSIIVSWIERYEEKINSYPTLFQAVKLQQCVDSDSISLLSERAIELCLVPTAPIFNAYGGYYFSPFQALQIDALRATVPLEATAHAVALASLIWVASRCAASPGHTAQPFKPNQTAGKYLKEAWKRDVLLSLRQSYARISLLFAKQKGDAAQAEANLIATKLGEGDIAFIDPPYSGVHYSRFYHVLETLIAHEDVSVSGSGRYPPIELRPQSDYSIKKLSQNALFNLLKTISSVGSDAILTFPSAEASNGLSGDIVRDLADEFFVIRSAKVTSRFSTLGGNLRNRDARQASEELILTLKPRA